MPKVINQSVFFENVIVDINRIDIKKNGSQHYLDPLFIEYYMTSMGTQKV